MQKGPLQGQDLGGVQGYERQNSAARKVGGGHVIVTGRPEAGTGSFWKVPGVWGMARALIWHLCPRLVTHIQASLPQAEQPWEGGDNPREAAGVPHRCKSFLLEGCRNCGCDAFLVLQAWATLRLEMRAGPRGPAGTWKHEEKGWRHLGSAGSPTPESDEDRAPLSRAADGSLISDTGSGPGGIRQPKGVPAPFCLPGPLSGCPEMHC